MSWAPLKLTNITKKLNKVMFYLLITIFYLFNYRSSIYNKLIYLSIYLPDFSSYAFVCTMDDQ